MQPENSSVTLAPATPYSAAQLRLLRDQYDRTFPWLSRALRHGGDLHTRDSLWEMLAANTAQLWPLPNAVGVTVTHVYPRGKVCVVWLAAGKLDELLDYEPKLAEWAKQNGCTHLEMDGRVGWKRKLRKLGWDRETITLRREL